MEMTWDDITVGQWMAFCDSGAVSEDDTVREWAALTGLASDDEIDAMTLEDIDALKSRMSFLWTPMESEFRKEVTVDGVEYVFEENLHSMKFGAWTDMEHWIGEGVQKTLPQLLAIFWRPRGEAYDGAKAAARVEAMRKMPVTDAHATSVFFCDFATAYTRISRTSS